MGDGVDGGRIASGRRDPIASLRVEQAENSLRHRDEIDAVVTRRLRIETLERHSQILTLGALLSLGVGFVTSPIGILVGSLVALGFMERRRDRRRKLERLIADLEAMPASE